MALTLLVQVPDTDALRQLVGDLPSLAAAAAAQPNWSAVLIGDNSEFIDMTSLDTPGGR